jgi:hypothetical protein
MLSVAQAVVSVGFVIMNNEGERLFEEVAKV